MSNVLFYDGYPSPVFGKFTITDTVITFTGNQTAFFAFPILVKENTTYHIELKITGGNIDIRLRNYSDISSDRDSNYINSSYSRPTTNSLSLSFTTPANTKYLYLEFHHASAETERTVYDIMINEGNTAPPYEPYGYKIPISSGNATTPVYISAPLRKSLDGTVFDILDSTGLVTYNVDEYGAPLVTPTTATVTVPTITSALGRTVISFGTSIQPSEFDMTYHGWHSHIPSIRSNNAWS